jgi:hypothetical protein
MCNQNNCIKRATINSKEISYAEYDADNKSLTLHMRYGAVYVWQPLTEDWFTDLVNAKDKDSFYYNYLYLIFHESH